MSRNGFRRVLMAGAAVAALAMAASAQTATVSGHVTDGTTNKPAADVTLTLLSLEGGMQPIAHTSSDAAGQYHFGDVPGNTTLMVQADYQGVPYFQPLTAGQPTNNIGIEVYEASHDESKIHLDAEIAVVQPEQGDLAVVDEYRAENDMAPPRTLYQTGGLFRFRVPAGATVDGARVMSTSKLPVDSVPNKTAEANVYRLDFPLRPGETRIQVSYRVPYPGLKATLHDTPIYPTRQFELYLPAPMTLQAPGFVQLGTQDNYKVFGPTATTAVGSTVAFSVAGTAPMPPDTGSDDSSGGAGGATGGATGGDAATETASATAPAAPAASTDDTGAGAAAAAPAEKTFFERNMWTLLALLGLAGAAGFGALLSKRPEAAMATAAPATATAAVSAGAGEQPRPAVTVVSWSGPPAASPAPAMSAAAAAAPAPAPAPNDFDRLRNDLFLLELRRYGQNIDEAEYRRLRAQVEEQIRRLVQGG